MSKNELGVKVGDFFRCSWGYDQTNIDFYKVVGVTAKGVRVQAWRSKSVEAGYSQPRVVPGDGPKTSSKTTLTPDEFYAADYWTRQEHSVEVPAPIRFHRTNSGWNGESVNFTVNSYSIASLWDGTAQYDTIAAGDAGH